MALTMQPPDWKTFAREWSTSAVRVERRAPAPAERPAPVSERPVEAGAGEPRRGVGARVLWLRVLSIAALVASAMLFVEIVRPGRGFCPLEGGCERARTSALGTVFGLPTSAVGLLAFGSLFALTMIPWRAARAMLRPAGLLAAGCGAFLIGYQAFHLGSFCPFCVVADSAAIAAGVVVLGWPSVARGAAIGVERSASRLAWGLVGLAAVGGPLLWPRPAPAAWAPVPASAWIPDAGEPAGAPDAIATRDAAPPASAAPTEATATVRVAPAMPSPVDAGRVVATSDVEPAGPRDGSPAVISIPPPPPPPSPLPPAPPPPPSPLPEAGTLVGVDPAPASEPPAIDAPSPPGRTDEGPSVAAAPPPATSATAREEGPRREGAREDDAKQPAPLSSAASPGESPARAASEPPATRAVVPKAAPPVTVAPSAAARAKPAAPPVAKPEVTLVEYLNPFCPHCRATHARLENVIPKASCRVRRYRVYVWASDTIPLWAQACACAAAYGKEDALFAELLRTPREEPEAIWGAAERAGIDSKVLWASVSRGDAVARLQEEWRRVTTSRVQQLPTLDVGRRRLEGEQSESELGAAIEAAADVVRSSRANAATEPR